MEPYGKYNFVMSISDTTSSFLLGIPTSSKLSGEQAYKKLFKHWITPHGKPKEVKTDCDIRFRSFWRGMLKALNITFTQFPPYKHEKGICEKQNDLFETNLRLLMSRSKSRDWPKWCWYSTYVCNRQINPITKLSPAEHFLGRRDNNNDFEPLPQEYAAAETVGNHIEMMTQAQTLLQQNRYKRFQQRNKHRVPASYQVGDQVLIHRKRFPNRKKNKVTSPSLYYGPYRVHRVGLGSVHCRVSPLLGGNIEVDFKQLKRYPPTIEEWEEDDLIGLTDVQASIMDEGTDIIQDAQASEVQPEQKAATSEPEADSPIPEISYTVESILSHKYRHTWRFLVHWRGESLEDSTWEPYSNFVLDDGSLNKDFKQYCVQNQLQEALSKAEKLSKIRRM